MHFSAFGLLAGRRHQLDAVVLMRGESFMETVEPGGMAVVVIVRGTATISRPRSGAQAGLFLTPRRGEPIWLTTPGTYCVVAKDHVIAMRMLKTGDTP